MKIFHHAAEALNSIAMPYSAAQAAAEAAYPAVLNDYYLSLIDPAAGENDPIYRQAIPSAAELGDCDSSFDPLAEEEQMPVPRLIHRFTDRVVLLANGRCAMRCRFCFRKRTWKSGTELSDISAGELSAAVDYLRRTPSVREVLVSGGDPLFMNINRLQSVLDALYAIPSIETVRVASRLPAVAPMLITGELIAMLQKYPSLWLATHFNHDRELTPEAGEALGKFVRAGIPVINQTVLLKGVNDDAAELEKLFRHLVKLRVKPHYLFHVDPVRGVRHFATGIACGLEILRQFRPRLSSLAVPTFAIDLPEGGGKVALQPDYTNDGKYQDIRQTKLISYEDLPPDGEDAVRH